MFFKLALLLAIVAVALSAPADTNKNPADDLEIAENLKDDLKTDSTYGIGYAAYPYYGGYYGSSYYYPSYYSYGYGNSGWPRYYGGYGYYPYYR